MFIYSVKGQNIKLVLSFILSAAVIILAVFLTPGASKIQGYDVPANQTPDERNFKNIRTNEDRVEFLRLYGWDVEPEAREVSEVLVPSEFDKVYENYNQLQTSEGMDLSKYKGKSVKRYTYLVNNYDYNGTVLANLLIYNDVIIGGDICSLDVNGFMHGLSKGSNSLS